MDRFLIYLACAFAIVFGVTVLAAIALIITFFWLNVAEMWREWLADRKRPKS